MAETHAGRGHTWMGWLLATLSLVGLQGAGAVTEAPEDQRLSDPEAINGVLENPSPGSVQSGITVFSGWVCDANTVTLVIDGNQSLQAAYPTDRADTEPVCGDRDNGFGLLFNYNLLGDGPHTVQARADGVEFDRAQFTVQTLGGRSSSAVSSARLSCPISRPPARTPCWAGRRAPRDSGS